MPCTCEVKLNKNVSKHTLRIPLAGRAERRPRHVRARARSVGCQTLRCGDRRGVPHPAGWRVGVALADPGLTHGQSASPPTVSQPPHRQR